MAKHCLLVILLLFFVFALRSSAAAQDNFQAHLIIPSNGSAVEDTVVTFSWSQVSDAEAYYLYVGTSIGSKDTLDTGEISTTTLKVSLNPSTPYFARLWTKKAAAWSYVDSTFSTTTGRARLIDPSDAATDVDPLDPMHWNAVSDAVAYYLYVGTTPGAQDIYGTGEVLNTAVTVSRLQPFTTYYARMWTKKPNGQWLWVDITFTTGSGIAHVLTPKDGANDVDPQTLFRWNTVINATAYYLYIGSEPGSQDIFGSGETSESCVQVPDLKLNQKYFVRMWTNKEGRWSFSDSTFTTGTGVAHVLSPIDGSVDVDPTTVIRWTTVPDATSYYLYVGTEQGGQDVFGTGETLAESYSLPFLAIDQQYYLRLFTNKDGKWSWVDSTFRTGTGVAQLMTPLNGESEVDPDARFTWNPIVDATAYYLYIGTSPGLNDIYDSGEVQNTTISPYGLESARTYSARLWTKKASGWRFIDSLFTTGNGRAQFTYPDSSLVDPFTMFSWTTVKNAVGYYLNVGTQLGGNDVFDSAELSPATTSRVVSGMLPDAEYFARLYTHKDSRWVYTDMQFHTSPAVQSKNRTAFYSTVRQLISDVRAMADRSNVVVPESPLAFETILWGRTHALCSDYANVLLQLFAQNDIFARLTTVTLLGNYDAWHATVEYFDPFTQSWSVADPTFGLIFFDDDTQQGQSVLDLSGFVAKKDWASIKPKFVTPLGSTYAADYPYDPITLYLNVIPTGDSPLESIRNAPEAILTLVTDETLGLPGTYVIRFTDSVEGAEIASSSGTITLKGIDSSPWSRIIVLESEWSLASPLPEGSLLYRLDRKVL